MAGQKARGTMGQKTTYGIQILRAKNRWQNHGLAFFWHPDHGKPKFNVNKKTLRNARLTLKHARQTWPNMHFRIIKTTLTTKILDD